MLKRTITLSALTFCLLAGLNAQSTGLAVYQILQEKCVACHDNASPQNGLDLEGAGASVAQKAADVFNNIIEVTPSNAYAAGENYQYIYPGRPDRSFLFRKANQGLEETISMHPDEEGAMPPSSQPQLTDVEKEMIRQWILYGAPADGEVVEQQLLEDYYGGQGLASFDSPPPAPDPSEGFQVKVGPFYLTPQGQPGSEREYFQKYELDMPADVDVDRIDIKIATSSHHLIIYDFEAPIFASFLPAGLRLEADHSAVGLVAAVQEATDLRLPETTAFMWEDDLVLDLNSHYINYSASMIYQAEAYINIYTKPAGTAEHEMKTELIVNGNIPIPNNGNPIDHTQTVVDNSFGEIFIWGMMGHTHKYGTDYKVYKRENSQQGELIYDASCAGGIPGCASPFFDYQHIPMSLFEPALPLDMTGGNGMIHTASWLNDGPFPVNFGPTSDDEMMVLVIMYTDDQYETPSAVEESIEYENLDLFPNPMNEIALLRLPENTTSFSFRLYDVLGQEVRRINSVDSRELMIERGGLQNGMYVYIVEEESGKQYSGKLILE